MYGYVFILGLIGGLLGGFVGGIWGYPYENNRTLKIVKKELDDISR